MGHRKLTCNIIKYEFGCYLLSEVGYILSEIFKLI